MRKTRTKKQAPGPPTLTGWNDLLRPDIHTASWVIYGVVPADEEPEWEFMLISVSDQKPDPVRNPHVVYVVRGFKWKRIVSAYRDIQKDRDRFGGSLSPSSGRRLTTGFSRTLGQRSGRYRKTGTLDVLERTDCISAFHHSSSGG